MSFIQEDRARPTVEDILRGIAYSVIAVWTILFLVFPPTSYASTIDVASRYFWLLACCFGAVIAAVGSFLRIDLKMELPGLIVMGIGPLFYFAANIYYISVPPPPTFDSTVRISLSVYAIIPLLLTMPRLWGLYTESLRAKNIRTELKRQRGAEQ